MSSGGARNVRKTSDKIKDGTFRKERHSNLLESKVPILPQMPPPPDGWNAAHVKKWNEVCELLFEAGVLTKLDLHTVAMYCQNCIIAQDAWESICQQGATLMIETAAGVKPMRNPAHIIYTEAQKVMRQLQEQFGMTPKSRQYLKVEKPKDDVDPLENLN